MVFDIALLPESLQMQIRQGETVVISDAGKAVAMVNPAPSYANGDFNFDLNEMKAAVESGGVPVPKSALADVEAFDDWLRKIGA